MVGPSLSTEEQREASLRLKAAIVALVGASAGLMALQARASLVQTALFVVGGLVLGWFLVAYLVRIAPTGRS